MKTLNYTVAHQYVTKVYKVGREALRIISNREYREYFRNSGFAELLLLWMVSKLDLNTNPSGPKSKPQALEERIR
jgi:hypothetical protein